MAEWIAYMRHSIMYRYYQWHRHFIIRRMARRGKAAGLPSIDHYSDDAITKGMIALHHAKAGDRWPDGSAYYDGDQWRTIDGKVV